MKSDAPKTGHCFFCGHALALSQQKDRFQCVGCQATFQGKRDPEGCLIELKVINCGTPDCCQNSTQSQEGSCGSSS